MKDAADNRDSCTQTIRINHDQNYFIKFPADLIVTACSPETPPTFYGIDCEKMKVTYTDEIVPDNGACALINRIWKIINTCTFDSAKALIMVPNPAPSFTMNHPTNLPGVTVSAPGTTLTGWFPTTVKLTPIAPNPTDFSIYWDKNANGYQYTQKIRFYITTDPAIQGCSSTVQQLCNNEVNDELLWKGPPFLDNLHGNKRELCESDQ